MREFNPPFEKIKTDLRRLRAIAYLIESHNNEILPVLEMKESWSIVGTIINDLGGEIYSAIDLIEEEYLEHRQRQ